MKGRVHVRRLAKGGRQVTLRDVFLSMHAEQARELARVRGSSSPEMPITQ